MKDFSSNQYKSYGNCLCKKANNESFFFVKLRFSKTKKPLDGATTAVYSFKIDMQKIPLSGFGGAVIGR